MSEAQSRLCEELLKKNRQLKAENERLAAKVNRLTARGFEDLNFENGELRDENRRLRSLVSNAYAEGFNDGGLACSPMSPSSDWRDLWKESKAREDLGDE